MAVLDLTTATRVKDLGLISGSNHDAILAVLITAVSQRFETWLGRWTKSENRTEYYDIRRGQRLVFLKGRPVSTVTNCWNDPWWDFSDAVDTDLYSILGDDGRIAFREDLLAGQKALKITYTGGMSDSTNNFIIAFPDVALAADMQTYYQFQRRNQGGLTTVSAEGATVTYPEVNLLKEVEGILAPHRRWSE